MTKLLLTLIVVSTLTCGLAHAQNAASGSGAVTTPANPEVNAATNAKPAADPTSGRSGSGTSTSGGKDANGDGGRDKMPSSNMEVRPLSQQK
jgi:hypothetical protein